MRLSWPRDDDKRRAIIGHFPPSVMCARPGTNFFFINTAGQDIELYRRLAPQVEHLPEADPSPGLWNQSELRASHMDLVYYCKSKRHPGIDQVYFHSAHCRYSHQSTILPTSR
jgi:hypothetical protein